VEFAVVAEVGARTGDVLQMLDQMPPAPWDIVVVALGVNDVTKAVPRRRWIAQQAVLLDRLTAQFGARYVVLSGVPPMQEFPLLPQPLRWVLGRQAARFDQALRQLVAGRADSAVVRIDLRLDRTNMSADGFHPGPVVYEAWADVIADQILASGALLDAPLS
jgi:lysophospholipase L1-like esterase